MTPTASTVDVGADDDAARHQAASPDERAREIEAKMTDDEEGKPVAAFEARYIEVTTFGGFGAGSGSMWDVMGALEYKFSNRFSAIAGYRVLGVDYEKVDFAYEVEQSGVMLGGVFTF